MNEGNPPNLPLNRLTDPRSIYGTAHQHQQQLPLASYLNQSANQQQQLQVLQSLLQQQQQQQQQQQVLQSLAQPLHLGLLQNVNGLSPSTIAGLSPDLQSQLVRSLAGSTTQNTDLLLAIEKQNILDRARALNQMEIRRALEREQEQQAHASSSSSTTSSSLSRPSSLRQEQPLPQMRVTAMDASLNRHHHQSLNHHHHRYQQQQPRPMDAFTRSLTPSTYETTSESSGDGATQAPPLPFAEGSVKDLRMVQDSTWEARFRDLVQFKLQHGHCNVPRRYKANPKLGVWVCSLRQQMTRGTLNKAKVERLNQIGFQWRITVIKGAQINPQIAKMDKWNENLGLLEQIKDRTGSCTVPSSNRKLCKWVYKQRREMDQGKLSIEKQDKLNAIGFLWKPEKTSASNSSSSSSMQKQNHHDNAEDDGDDEDDDDDDDDDDDYVKISDNDEGEESENV